jgi:hypothetical protein
MAKNPSSDDCLNLRGDDPMIAKIPQPLDVLLVRGTSPESTALCFAQTVMMKKSVHFSHAIVTITQGVYLHATGEGVHVIRPADVWKSPHYRAEKLVLRNRNIAAMTIGFQSKVAQHRAAKTYGDRYNYWIGIPKKLTRPDAWFCSELAADHLEAAGHCVCKGRRPERIWPGHFEYCKNNPEWIVVTGVHRQFADWTIGGKSDDAPNYCKAFWSMGEASFLVAQQSLQLSSDAAKSKKTIDYLKAELGKLLIAIEN